jgi:hypothetical protein
VLSIEKYGTNYDSCDQIENEMGGHMALMGGE